MLFLLILGPFWCSVVTSVTFSSNISSFEKNPKKCKKKHILNIKTYLIYFFTTAIKTIKLTTKVTTEHQKGHKMGKTA